MRLRRVVGLGTFLLALGGVLIASGAYASTTSFDNSGPSGPSGNSGVTGASGSTGTTGISGPSGPTGLAALPFPQPTWTDTVGPIALSSPTVATINGVTAVVFGSENGFLNVVDAETGANLPGWPEPVVLAPGLPTAIESSPTVAYLDGPAHPPSIIVGAGSTYASNQVGGLIAFRADGSVRFRFHTRDIFNEWHGTGRPDGYPEAVFSTPAVGDITGSGGLEIVFGSYDHNLYALTARGTLVPGFPLDTEDTIWSSPALFHVRGKARQQDIFIGGDASGRNHCFGGFVYDITYKKQKPRVVWSHCKNQTIWSSPAIGVINSTNRPAVVVGTGFGEVPPYKSDAYKLFAFYADNGARVAGWPVKTAGPTFGSPAIGPLTLGGPPVVVDSSWCMTCSGTSMVYAWSGTGAPLWADELPGPNIFSSPTLVDLTGTATNDVVIGAAGGLFALDGPTGEFLFGTSPTQGINTCSAQNEVAVADVEGESSGSGWHLFEACGGPHQLIGTGRLIDYPLPAIPAIAPAWPMWRADENHDGVSSTISP
jgi:hypothetical protein